MSARNWRPICLATCALLTVVQAGADPLKNPHRMVGGRSIDLSPLFQWWRDHSGERPLPAWVHITGPITATNSWGWVVSSKEGKILLRNPPVQDQADFERLSGQLKALEKQRTQLIAEENQAKARAAAAGRTYSRRGRATAIAAAQARQVEHQDQAGLKVVDDQIQAVKKKLAGYPKTDQYEVDCLALKTGSAYGALKIFDHGLGY